MIELRRLRAVLLLASVSAIAWGILGVMAILGSRLIAGGPLFSDPLLTLFFVFAFFGLVAGGLFSLGLGLASSRGRQRVTRAWGTLFGAAAGALVWLGLQLTVLEPLSVTSLLNIIRPMAIFTGLGGIVGFAICHVAARKELPAGIERDSLPPAR